LLETGLNQRLLEEGTHSQHISSLRQVGNIKGCTLLPHDPENIMPLPHRRAPSHLKPLQFGQDAEATRTGRVPASRVCAWARRASSLVKARCLRGIRSTLSIVPRWSTL